MGHDEKALIRLWQEKRGEIGPEDLSTNLIVQLGLVTEDLNRQWYERNTGNAISRRSHCGEQRPPDRAPLREPAIGRVEVRGEAHIAIDQKAVETEDLHFLGGFDAGGGLPHIVEFAPLRRAAVVERIARPRWALSC